MGIVSPSIELQSETAMEFTTPTKAHPTTMDTARPCLKLERHKTRKKKSTGEIVLKSSTVHHFFKIGKRALKTRKLYYASGYDDNKPLVAPLARAWAQVHHPLCRKLADLLLVEGLLTRTMYECVCYEFEAILEWVASNGKEAAKMDVPSAALLVGILSQQAKALTCDNGWEMESQEEIERWTLDAVYERFNGTGVDKSAPAMHGRYLNIVPLAEAARPSAVQTILKWLVAAAPPSEFNALRTKRTDNPWLEDGIVALKPANKLQKADVLPSDLWDSFETMRAEAAEAAQAEEGEEGAEEEAENW